MSRRPGGAPRRRCAQFLSSLEERGAFAQREPGDRWFVVCNERVNRERHREQGIVNLMFGFPAGERAASTPTSSAIAPAAAASRP